MKHVDLDALAKIFPDVHFRNAESSIDYQQTGFVWSSHGGTLCLATGRQYFETAIDNKNICAIVAPGDFGLKADVPIVVGNDPDQIFHFLHTLNEPEETVPHYISPEAIISSAAHVEAGVHIEEGVVVEAGSYIAANTIVSKNTYIGANVTLGTQGLLAKNILGQKRHLPHLGGVYIGENSYLHAGCNVSRALFKHDQTRVGNNTHLGIQVNIAHDSQVGSNCEISANTVVAGRAQIQNNVWVGANCTISNWVKIEDNVKVRLGSTVINDVLEGEDVSGNFAIPHRLRLFEYAQKISKKK